MKYTCAYCQKHACHDKNLENPPYNLWYYITFSNFYLPNDLNPSLQKIRNSFIDISLLYLIPKIINNN